MMKRLVLASLFLACSALGASAAITYDVSRIIGAGSVTGTIQTDGTLGTLTSSNILDWTLTLTSPNLYNGPVVAISKLGGGNTTVLGSALSATATNLLFDFSATNSFFALAKSPHGWCLATAGATCVDELPPSEVIFSDPLVVGFAEIRRPSGQEIIATARPAGVPEPVTLALFGAGLAGVVAFRRRKAA